MTVLVGFLIYLAFVSECSSQLLTLLFSVVNQLWPGCLCFSIIPVLLLLLLLGVGSLEGQLVMKHPPKGLEEARSWEDTARR